MAKKDTEKKEAPKKEIKADAKKEAPKASSRKRLDVGILHVQSTYNNTKVMLSDKDGQAESAIRGFISKGVIIASIKDETPVPFNGPQAKKPRRV